MDKRYRKDDEWIDWDERLFPMKGRRTIADHYTAMSPTMALDELERLALKSGSCTREETDILTDIIRQEIISAF